MAGAFTNAQGDEYVREILWNGYDANLKPEVVEVLNRAQQLVDFPISLTSGYRDPKRNASAGGAKKSQHLTGNAVDISVKGLTDDQRTQLTRALVQSGALRLGAYSGNTGLHLDMAKGYKPVGEYPVYAMFDRSASNMAGAQPWFKAGLDGGKIPPMNIPQVATALDTAPASVVPASLSDGLQQRRAATLPTYNITPVPSRRSDKNINNRKEQATVMGGINLPLQNAMMPPQPPMKPAAGGYKTAGKEFLNDQRFASGMADKTALGTPRVASLGPMPPLPLPRPQSPVTAMPNTVAPGLITDTFATLGFERDSGGVKVADLYKDILPIAPLVPRPAPGQSYAGQDRAMPQLPPSPLPMPRSMRPADPGLIGIPSFQFGTPGLPAGLPAQVPPTRALPPMPRPRPMMPPMVTVSGAAPRAMPPMPLPRPMGMPVQQFQAQGLSPQQAYAAANQAAQERAIANSRDPERNAARASLAARWGFD